MTWELQRPFLPFAPQCIAKRGFGPAHIGQMSSPSGPFAIYGSRPPGATLVLPELAFRGSGDPKSPPWFAKTAHRGRFERLSVASSVGHIPRDYGRPVAAHRMQWPRRRFERYRQCRARERQPELRIGGDRQQQDAVGHDFQQHLLFRYHQLDSRIGLRLPGHWHHSTNDVGRGTNRFLHRPVPTYSSRRSDRNDFL